MATEKPEFTIKVGEKKGVVVGGKMLGQRFPVTLYAQSWLNLLEHAEEIKQFIEANKSSLAWKEPSEQD